MHTEICLSIGVTHRNALRIGIHILVRDVGDEYDHGMIVLDFGLQHHAQVGNVDIDMV